MIPKNRISTHPGKILLHEYLEPMGLTQKDLATHLEIPVQRINEIIRGKRGISPDTAWLLSEALDTSPEFWSNLQSMYDLSSSRPNKKFNLSKQYKLTTNLRSRFFKWFCDGYWVNCVIVNWD